MDVEIFGEELSGAVVDVEKLLCFVCQFEGHVGHVSQLLQVVTGETHISSYFPLVHALS